ncbi:MAG: trimethylguanosine synthase [Candidatus Thermoplasmatota archaeon]|nr:trimethylguanosine synthase [Candidatus Thermoplasmatota archaeon]
MVSEDSLYRFLRRIYGNRDVLHEEDEKISVVMELIRHGMDLNAVRKRLDLDKNHAGILYEIAHARISIREKFTQWKRLWMDQYLARYSTPEIICRYRSERIRDHDIVDMGSGGGIQSIFFSMTNRDVTGIELNPARHLMSELNIAVYQGGRVSFVKGDAMKYTAGIKLNSDTVIFSDPARPPGSPERTLDTLIPSPEKIYRMLSDRTDNFVFDLPPQIRWERITIQGEKEYASIDGQLNRLTLYSGSLQKSEVSAVLLPQNIRVGGEPQEIAIQADSDILDHILVPDPAVTRAKLIHAAIHGIDATAISYDGRRCLITSRAVPSEFPGEAYRTEFVTDEAGLGQAVRDSDAAKVIPRYRIPDSLYYGVRKKLSSGLTGSRDIYLFLAGNRYIGCTKLVRLKCNTKKRILPH